MGPNAPAGLGSPVAAGMTPRPAPVVFYLPFRGTASPVRPGVLLVRATAPCSSLSTAIDGSGLHARLAVVAGEEAHLESRISRFDDGTFEETGTISVGNGNVMRFRSTGRGSLARAGVDLEEGAVASVVELGGGVYAGATGRLATTLVLSRTGDLAQHVIGVVFLPGPGG